MTPEADIGSIYQKYITAIRDAVKTHDLSPLSAYTHDSVIYNGQKVSANEYQSFISPTTDVPDLKIEFKQLIVDIEGRHVSAYIVFTLTPPAGAYYMGMRSSGKTIAYAESVIYTFVDGKIAEVWTVVDRDAVRQQLEG